ncbi:hypothetical protein JK191_01125 [Gluconobacter sphaericus]|uniref:hypothetical protein n=1 Tax=Gluconobacter sphaericus TaxID=574987 RepID=UPI001B8B4DFC|nr:hypothetical protein [Gluconobacter sphaericus]MBS1096196.1 hypothetical protein [Gluconobacter sphaericus]
MRMYFSAPVLCALFALHGVAGATPATTLQELIGSKLGVSRYQGADVVLNEAGTSRQYLVYARDRKWCGATGGCTLFILTNSGNDWRILSRMMLVQLPVHLLPHLSQGWHDLVISYSGRLPDGHPALVSSRMQFNGVKYPSNPSVPPAEPMTHLEGLSILVPGSPIQTSTSH